MVIQPNMPVDGIMSTWPNTVSVFERYGVEVDSRHLLGDLELGVELKQLISELNATVENV